MCPCSVPTVPQYSAPRAWVRARGPAAPVGRKVDGDPYIYALVGMWGVGSAPIYTCSEFIMV